MSTLLKHPGADAAAAHDDLEQARHVLATEAAGLEALSAALDDRFVQAVDLLTGATGRVIVTGMGKSGHIGVKIASTLASTGTPAHFVHPGEASHGDLGMITAGDVVVCLSNSGGTSELADLIAHTRRFSIPLVGIASRTDSALIHASDVPLLIPPVEEACPVGKAPTTSTTCMLALGDALAVALMARRGFTAEDFKKFHPGGRLGASLVRVSSLMHGAENLPVVGEEVTMGDALLVMTSSGYGCVGVISPAGDLVGVVTDGDLRRNMSDDLAARSAREIMGTSPKTISADALAAKAVARMQKNSITSLFVVEDGSARPVGFLNIHDCLKAGVI